MRREAEYRRWVGEDGGGQMLGGMGGERDRVVCLRWCGWGAHEGLVMYSVTDHGCVHYGWLWVTTVAAESLALTATTMMMVMWGSQSVSGGGQGWLRRQCAGRAIHGSSYEGR